MCDNHELDRALWRAEEATRRAEAVKNLADLKLRRAVQG